MITGNRKRYLNSPNNVQIDKRSRKCSPNDLTEQNSSTDKFYDQTLSEEYQPQFFNYQLIGDLVAIMILHSKDVIEKKKFMKPILFGNYCHTNWSVTDLLSELKSKKECCKIAKTVILSVGYNDYHENSMNAFMLAEHIEKVTQKLHRRGCKDIILANVPPCAANKDSIEHWQYLQIINEEILKLSERYDYICHCNIFRLFCTPVNYFKERDSYVTFREANYKVELAMYNIKNSFNKNDLISFSDLGKKMLGLFMKKTVENRLEDLRRVKVQKVINLLEEPANFDRSTPEIIEIINTNNEKSKIIDLDATEKEGNVKGHHYFGCTCKICHEEDEKLMNDMLNTIKCFEDVKDENSTLPS